MSIPTKPMTRAEYQAEAENYLKGNGYKRGGRLNHETDAAQDSRMIKKAVGQHETHDHPGKPHTQLKLKRGGKVEGAQGEKRMDKRARSLKRADGGPTPPQKDQRQQGNSQPGRNEDSQHGPGDQGGDPKYARGGAAKAKGHKPSVTVNIVSPAAAEGEKKQAATAGIQAGMKMGAAQAARPMAPPPGAGGPPGAGAGAPRPPMPPAGAMPPRPMGPPGAGGPPMGAKRGGRLKAGGKC